MKNQIYVYKLWDFWNGYWTPDTESNREKIDGSDDKYYVEADSYNELAARVPHSGNLVEF